MQTDPLGELPSKPEQFSSSELFDKQQSSTSLDFEPLAMKTFDLDLGDIAVASDG